MAADTHTSIVARKTLLFTDLVDSTAMAQKLGDERSVQVVRSHDRLARDLLRQHNGVEMKKSDGFLFMFETPASALQYALAFHFALLELAREVDVPIACRVGVHTGEVFIQRNDEEDIKLGAQPWELEGLAVPVTARVMSLASAWQTLVTKSVYDEAADDEGIRQFAENVRWLDHGNYLLKGVGDPVAVFEIGVEGVAPLRAPHETDKVRRVGSGLPSIVVLPFKNLSPGGENDYFCDGLTDEIITDLSFMDTLRVISSNASMQLKDSARDIETIRRELNVQYVIEGSARASRDRIRINVKLINSLTGELVWGDKFGGSLDDLFEFEEQISRQVTEALKVKLTPREDRKLAERAIPNIQAYEYYLRARQEVNRYTEDALERALEYLRNGADIAGDNIHFVSAVGYVHWQYFNIGLSTDPSHLEIAQECAQKCLELDPDAADGHRLSGLVSIFLGEVQQAFVHLRNAIDRNANDIDALFWLILMSGLVGKTHTVGDLLERLLKIDPLTPQHQFMVGWIPLWEGRYGDAIGPMEKAHRMEPGNPMMALVYGQTLAMNGDVDASARVFEATAQTTPDSPFARLGQFLNYAQQGEYETARAVVDEDLRGFAVADPQWSWILAQGYALIGASAEALEWMSGSVSAGFMNYLMLAEHDPFLANIRDEQAFAELVATARTNCRAFLAWVPEADWQDG